MSDSEAVLDASALLAVFGGEPGAERVRAVLLGATISAVNLAEVVGKLTDRGIAEADIRLAVEGQQLVVISFDGEAAYEAGSLPPATRAMGLSLADRACLALARKAGLPAMTADREWRRVRAGVEVRVIR